MHSYIINMMGLTGKYKSLNFSYLSVWYEYHWVQLFNFILLLLYIYIRHLSYILMSLIILLTFIFMCMNANAMKGSLRFSCFGFQLWPIVEMNEVLEEENFFFSWGQCRLWCFHGWGGCQGWCWEGPNTANPYL